MFNDLSYVIKKQKEALERVVAAQLEISHKQFDNIRAAIENHKEFMKDVPTAANDFAESMRDQYENHITNLSDAVDKSEDNIRKMYDGILEGLNRWSDHLGGK